MGALVNKRVVVLGGGIGGLSAALHLGRRGFQVDVYEASNVAGGKARSYPAPRTGRWGRPGWPAEHGFRHIANFYRHLPDTLEGIPSGQAGGSVWDTNVTTTARSELVQLKVAGLCSHQPAVDPLPVLDSFPSSLSDLVAILEDLTTTLGLWPGEAERFAGCLWEVATSCKDRRQRELDRRSWADFIGANHEVENSSPAYTAYLERGLSGALVAAQAGNASAATIGEIVVWLLANTLDAAEPDHVLNGPTSDKMIDPWLEATKAFGANWFFEHEVSRIECSNGTISGVHITDRRSVSDKLVAADYYVCALPPNRFSDLVTQEMVAADPLLNWVRTSSLNGPCNPTGNLAWMNGMQFYLKQDVPITPGYVLIAGSPWQITAFSEPQFWDLTMPDYGNGQASGLISVVVSNWDNPGRYVNKPAKECTQEEIFDEVFQQLMYSLNVDGKLLLTPDMIVHRTLDADLKCRQPSASDPARWINTVPLWINTKGQLLDRPRPVTGIPNLFLAADYPQCNTNFACMEAADECGRRATNGILQAAGSDEPRCEIWPMSMPASLEPLRELDQKRFDNGEPWRGTADPAPNPYRRIEFCGGQADAGIVPDAVQEDQLIQWWYWVAHLESKDKTRRFGTEIVFFSTDMTAMSQLLDSVRFLRRANLWPRMSQVGITDITNQQHVDRQVLGWGEPSSPNHGKDFHLTSWDDAIHASGGRGNDRIRGKVKGYEVDLQVIQKQLPTVHYGGNRRAYSFGGYTYYYSRESMHAEGTMRTPDGAVYDVCGCAWFDRQWGDLTQAVLRGWQWFAIQLGDGTRIMLFAFNGADAFADWSGSYTPPGGSTVELVPGDFQVHVKSWWRSPRTLIDYPSRWQVHVQGQVLDIRPLVADQEMSRRLLWAGPRYWEGACEVMGSQPGKAYVELVGFHVWGS